MEEAGWEPQGNFYDVAGSPGQAPSEARSRPDPVKIAGMLLQQLAAIDPAGAQQFLDGRVPEKFRAAVAKNAGFNSPPAP